MRTQAIATVLILGAVLLTACGENAGSTEDVMLSDVYTAVASTLAAQEISATAPATTPTTLATITPFTFPKTIPVTVTVQDQAKVSYNSPVSTANGCDNAVYVSDVTIPDGTVLAPGESFTKTWEFQNTGTCDWTENYLLTFVGGTEMDGDTTAIDQDVAAGETGDLSVTLVAPDSEGTYTGYWQLADEDGNVFGQSVYVTIVVSVDAATLTPTPTTASEDTPTLEPTATPTLTSSSVPLDLMTNTPTPVPTGSS